MKFKCLVSLLLFSLYSCNLKTSKIDVGESLIVISLEKLDSIRIDYIGNPTVHDVDPKTGTVLFMDHKEFSEEIFIADFEGNIRSSFSKFGDMPDTYGRLMSTIKINGTNSFLVYGYRGFLTYDFDGKLLSLIKYDDFKVPSESRIAMGFGMEKMSDFYLYVNQESRPSEIAQYEGHKLLSLVDTEVGKRTPIIGFPENSIFLNGNYFFSASWFPVFTHYEDYIYVAFGSEPEIYVFEANEPFKVKHSISLKLPNYYFGKGTDDPNDFKYIGMVFTSGRIENIKRLGEYFILGYFPGYDALDTEKSFENKSPEEAIHFREKMLKKYPSRLAILDSIGNVISDFVPDGLEPNSMLLRNGELWMMEKLNEEKEEDYFRLFRVGIKEESN